MTLGDFERVANELIRVKEENQELKKQLEELQKEYEEFQKKANDIQFELRDDRDNYYERLCDSEREKKKFIKYLEDEIKEEKDNLEKLCELYKIPKENNGAYKFAYSYISKIEMILQKYKKIIGENKDD